MEELGEKVARARAAQRYGVRAAADGAGISRDTWVRVEKGQGVHDTSRAAVLTFLGLDHHGDPLPEQADPLDEPGRDGLLDTYTDDELVDELRRRLRAGTERPTLTAVPTAARSTGRRPGNPEVNAADDDAETFTDEP